MQLNVIIPVLMSCAMLWWISRRMTWTKRLVAVAVTLLVIICVFLLERSLSPIAPA